MDHLVRGGVALAFEDTGKGAPPILLIHDYGRDHRSMQPYVNFFRRNHRVVAVDLRGHGQSDPLSGPYTVADYSADVAWLCYELGVYRPVAVARGLGAAIAVYIDETRQRLLTAVIVLDCAREESPMQIHARLDELTAAS